MFVFVWTIELSQIRNLQEMHVKKKESPLQTCHEHIVSVLMIKAFWVILEHQSSVSLTKTVQIGSNVAKHCKPHPSSDFGHAINLSGESENAKMNAYSQTNINTRCWGSHIIRACSKKSLSIFQTNGCEQMRRDIVEGGANQPSGILFHFRQEVRFLHFYWCRWTSSCHANLYECESLCIH